MTGRREALETSDGHRFEAYVSGDPGERPLLFYPALGVGSSYYQRFADALADVGFFVTVGELRGRETSSIRPGRGADYGYRELLEIDIPRVIEWVDEQTGGAPLMLAGHSLGGQLALLAGARHDADRVAVVASGLPSRHAWSRLGSWPMLGFSYLVDGIGSALGYFPGDKVGFGARDSSKLMSDWTRTVRTGRYEFPDSDIDWEGELRGYERPVTVLRMSGDSWVPPRAVEMLLEKTPRADAVRVEIEASAPGNPHFAWIKDFDPVVESLARFAGL